MVGRGLAAGQTNAIRCRQGGIEGLGTNEREREMGLREGGTAKEMEMKKKSKSPSPPRKRKKQRAPIVTFLIFF